MAKRHKEPGFEHAWILAFAALVMLIGFGVVYMVGSYVVSVGGTTRGRVSFTVTVSFIVVWGLIRLVMWFAKPRLKVPKE